MQLCAVALLLISVIDAQLNLYLDSSIVQQLFGINEHQLYFIDENQIRSAAVEARLRVPVDVDSIQLTWSEDRFDIDTPQLIYEYNTTTSNEQALLAPVLDVVETGIVPRRISTFSIFFPCMSSKRVNCSVLFRFYNSTNNQSSINIDLKFVKHCRDEILNRSFLSQFYNSDQIESYFLIREAHRGHFTPTAIVTVMAYSLVIALVVFLLVFCSAMSLFCLYRLTKTSKKKSDRLIDNEQIRPPLPLTFDMTTNFEDVSLYSCTQYDFMKNTDEFLSPATFADCTIDANRVKLHDIFLEGTYGCLFHCSLIDISQIIYGKTVKSTTNSIQLNQMLHDCCLFASIKHANINSPLGLVHMEELSPYPLIIYPFSQKGILKRYILQNRSSNREQLLSTQELVYMAIHVAKGLHYLHRRKMLMKDIGLRNCLVMDDLTVKLTDYALSRDLFPEDYHCLSTDALDESRPLKFMAIESIDDRRFSTASDVWSYGVLLWELMSRGLQPYADIDPSILMDHFHNNHRLVQPANCPDSLFKLMSICWTISIDQRPSMGSLLQSLMQFYGQLARFI